MKIKYLSVHAAARCHCRNISIPAVIDAVRNGMVTEAARGRKTFALGRLRVVLGGDGVVVTVWRDCINHNIQE